MRLLAVFILAVALCVAPSRAVLADADAFFVRDMCLQCRPDHWTEGPTLNCTDMSKISGYGPYRACDTGSFPGIACLAGNVHIGSITMDSHNVPCLPNSIGGLGSLNLVSITGNQLTALPQNFSQLTGLTALYASSNRISTVPSFANLGNLVRLYLDNNTLTDWPAGMNGLSKVLGVNLDRNAITTPVPSTIGGMTALSTLSFQSNLVTGPLPDALTLLVKLDTLEFGNNRVNGMIPSGIGALTALTRLWAPNNWILSTIPASFSALTRLNTTIGFGGAVNFGPPNRLCGCWPAGFAPVQCILTNSSFCNITSPPPVYCGGGIPRPDCTSCNDMVGCYSGNVQPPSFAPSQMLPSAVFVPSVGPAPPSSGALAVALSAVALLAALLAI